MTLWRPETPAVHADIVSRRIGFDSHLVNRAAIDGDASLLD
jgi:hypothetical protein